MAAIGGGQAVLGHAAKNQAASQRNKQRAAAYRAEKAETIRKHNADVTNYYLGEVDAEITMADAAIEANAKVNQQQLAINEAIANQFRDNEADYIEMISNERIAGSLERSGKSASRIASAAQAAVGRAAAGRISDVERASDKAKLTFEEINRWQNNANQQAMMSIGSIPTRGPGPQKPVFDKGPGLFSLVAGVGMGVAGGYMKDQQLKAFENIGKLQSNQGGSGGYDWDPNSKYLPGYSPNDPEGSHI